MIRSEGTNFTFYRKVNATDPWQLDTANGPIVHPELSNGVPLQVGLAQSMYTSAIGWVQFDSLMIDTATNLDPGGPPPSACSNLVMTVNPDFTITLNWQQGTNSMAPRPPASSSCVTPNPSPNSPLMASSPRPAASLESAPMWAAAPSSSLAACKIL